MEDNLKKIIVSVVDVCTVQITIYLYSIVPVIKQVAPPNGTQYRIVPIIDYVVSGDRRKCVSLQREYTPLQSYKLFLLHKFAAFG